MNDKFFDLKKEKQDRMINGAMKVFAQHGYNRASTDDMVKEAGISKGLWFHYFGNKLGLYTFIIDYSVKYVIMELAVTVNSEEHDYFQICRQIEQTKLSVRKQYPYIPLLLYSMLEEKDEEALQEVESFRQTYISKIQSLYEQVDYSAFRTDVDLEPLSTTMRYTMDAMLREAYETGSFADKKYIKNLDEFIEMMKGLTYPV